MQSCASHNGRRCSVELCSAAFAVELAKAGVSMEARGSDDKTVEEILK